MERHLQKSVLEFWKTLYETFQQRRSNQLTNDEKKTSDN